MILPSTKLFTDSWPILIDACLKNNINQVKSLLSTNIYFKDYWTPLVVACAHGQTKIANALILAGASIDEGYYATPLMFASEQGHKDIIEILICSGAYVNMKRKNDKWTPLLLACNQGYTDIAELLIEAGAEIDYTDNYGNTAEWVTRVRGHLDCLKLLSSYGAYRYPYIENPLYYYSHTVDYPYQQQHNIKQKQQSVYKWLKLSRKWCSPLHHLEIISTERTINLLRYGADINKSFYGGHTPLILAQTLTKRDQKCEAAELVISASEKWSRINHMLFPLADRKLAKELITIGKLLSIQPRFNNSAGGIVDIWLEYVIPKVIIRSLNKKSVIIKPILIKNRIQEVGEDILIPILCSFFFFIISRVKYIFICYNEQ